MSDYETKRIFSKNLSKLLDIHDITQLEFAKKMNVAASTVSSWCNGDKMPRMDKVEWMAEFFGVPRTSLISEGTKAQSTIPPGFSPMPQMQKVPLLGSIACGEPILAEEHIEGYVGMPDNIRADFALICKGDSMVNAGIRDGDVVYIRKQETVENGQIAAVIVEDMETEATLKRFYFENGVVTLSPENNRYPPKTFIGSDIERIRIVGLAVGFTHLYEWA